jgi:NAD(P)H-dependent FMN reductase
VFHLLSLSRGNGQRSLPHAGFSGCCRNAADNAARRHHLVRARKESLNSRLAQLAAVTVEANGENVDLASMAEFDAPSYDGDVQASNGFPAGAEEFRRRLELAGAFVVASPEYNASIPGALKNAIDWVSRFRPQPFKERHGLLVSASPSMVGGNRGLWALRIPFEHLGARLYPDMSHSRRHIGPSTLRDGLRTSSYKSASRPTSQLYPCAPVCGHEARAQKRDDVGDDE